MNTFLIPSAAFEATLEIKRSQFVTLIEHTQGVEAARAFLERVRARFPDANHHCYAYVAGAPDDIYQIDKSDDGEPRGTAGKPMLNVLQHSGIGEITAVVVRYFGGVKLGAGGLVRAYSQCVSQAVAALETIEFVRKAELQLTLPYSLLGSVEHWLGSNAIEVLDKRFEADVALTLAVPLTDVDTTIDALGELGQGSMVWVNRDDDQASD